jgi:hypothetical protein
MSFFLFFDDGSSLSNNWSSEINKATAFATEEDATTAIWSREVHDATGAEQCGDGWYIAKKTRDRVGVHQSRRRTNSSAIDPQINSDFTINAVTL